MVTQQVQAPVIYGVAVDSDRALPLPEWNAPVVLDQLSLRQAADLPAVSSAHEVTRRQTHGREFVLSTHGETEPGWIFEVPGLLSFRWTAGGHDIGYSLTADCPDALFTFWFVHVFLPMHIALERRGQFLHAGCVTINGRAVGLLAPSGSGKSTLVKALTEHGHALLADDKLRLDSSNDEVRAIPSHPFCRPSRDYETLGFQVAKFEPMPRKLDVLFYIEAVDAQARIEFDRLEGFRSVEHLMGCYLSGSLDQRQDRSERLASLAMISKIVPMQKLQVPRDMARLDEVCTAIEAFVDHLEPEPAAT